MTGKAQCFIADDGLRKAMGDDQEGFEVTRG